MRRSPLPALTTAVSAIGGEVGSVAAGTVCVGWRAELNGSGGADVMAPLAGAFRDRTPFMARVKAVRE